MSATFRVPYLSRLEGGGLQPGQTVVIKGVQTSDRFDVLFLNGQSPESADAGFSLSVHNKSILLNDRKGGKWGKEEKKKDPFKEGEHVDLRIRAHDNKFEVFANLKEIAEFEYRQPLNAINHLFVDGAIDLQEVNWGGKYYPVPYQAGVDGGFATGKHLFVSGVPEKKVEHFNIDLLNDKNEIVMHMDCRFNKKLIVRNAQLGGSWGTEEIEGKFPLQSDLAFDIKVVNEPYAFQVFINGTHFCAFAHRTDPNGVKGIRIAGDVILMGVHVK